MIEAFSGTEGVAAKKAALDGNTTPGASSTSATAAKKAALDGSSNVVAKKAAIDGANSVAAKKAAIDGGSNQVYVGKGISYPEASSKLAAKGIKADSVLGKAILAGKAPLYI